MGGFGRKNKPPNQPDDQPAAPRPPVEPAEDDSYEDGDFVTPKRDRNGTDDEPL